MNKRLVIPAAMIVLAIALTPYAMSAAPGQGAGAGGAGSAGGAGAQGAGSGSANTPPSTAAGFACQTCSNFLRPKTGKWENWSSLISPPISRYESDHYLCFTVRSIRSPTEPVELTNVAHLPRNDDFPCYKPHSSKYSLIHRPDRPLLHGDRFRIVLDFDDDTDAKAFVDNTSAINVDVTLATAPPLQPTLLRFNLGSPATAAGIGGAAAPEPGEFDDYGKCYEEIKAGQTLPGSTSCESLSESSRGARKPFFGARVNASKEGVTFDEALTRSDRRSITAPAKEIIILPWGYTLPGDVVPTVYLSFLYNSPPNGKPWLPNTFYTTGSIVNCPGEDVCAVAHAGSSGNGEPAWPGPQTIVDGNVIWTAIVGNVQLSRAPTYASDGSPTYKPGEAILWTLGQSQVQSTIGTWHPATSYVKNKSVVVIPDTPKLGKQTLYYVSGSMPPGSSAITDTKPPNWNPPPVFSEQGPVHEKQLNWTYETGDITSDPPDERWKSGKQYNSGDRIRCAQVSQRNTQCIANPGGYSGKTEPIWMQGAASQSGAGNSGSQGQASSPPTLQSDNEILWAPVTPTNMTPVQDLVVNSIGFEWEQTHSPALWGLSTAILMSTSSIPSGYSFQKTVTGGCLSVAPKTKSAVPVCPPLITATQKSPDIALMISPYVVHHVYSKIDADAPDGIDAESGWTGLHTEDWLPEPIGGFSLNSIGSDYYVGLSEELLIRNLQFIVGRAWVKGPRLTLPVTAVTSVATNSPNTYTGFSHTWFIGIAYNISGLVSGH